MKSLIIISFLLLPVCIFGQVQRDTAVTDKSQHQKKYIVGDKIIICDDCTLDFCGNLINSKKDTIAENTTALNNDNKPLYFTTTNVLLSTNAVKSLMQKNKVANISVLKCNASRQLFGDLAKYGIILVELKDTTIKTDVLLEFLNKSYPGSNIQIENILINGLKATDTKIKIPKLDKLILNFDSKKNIFNIKL